jgi:hypothetical protein
MEFAVLHNKELCDIFRSLSVILKAKKLQLSMHATWTVEMNCVKNVGWETFGCIATHKAKKDGAFFLNN